MSIATTTALAIGSIAVGAAGVGTSIAASGAAKKAADAQTKAAESGQSLQAKAEADSLAENKRQFDITQQNEQPFLQAGTNAVNFLDQNAAALSKPYGEQFHAPTLDEAKANPGYQFALDTGSQALASRAAAQGTLLSGQTGEALQGFGQRLGEQNYQDVFNNLFNQHALNYNEYNQNQTNTFNRYASLAGVGQQTASQLATLGANSAATTANINLTGANNQANSMNNAAAARASGYIGQANALSQIPGQVAGAITLQQLLAANKGKPDWGTDLFQAGA